MMENKVQPNVCVEHWLVTELSEIAKIATQKTGLQGLFSKVVDFVSKALDVERVSIMMPDENDPEHLVIKAAKGIPADVVQNARVRIGSGVSGYVFATGEPLLIGEVDDEAVKKFGLKLQQNYKAPSLLTVPIKSKNRVLGVINVNNKSSGASFCKSDLDFLYAVSGYVALAIENKEQYLELLHKQKELEQMAEELRTTLENQTKLLMKLSYSIRSPLTGILGYAELLLSRADSGLSESDKSLLRKIIDRSWKLAELAERIFEYESFVHDDTKLEPKRIDLTSLVDGVADRLKNVAREKQVRIEVDATAQPVVLADAFYLSKAISEVLENAVRHTKKGSTVRIELSEDKSLAQIRITDQGPGLPPEKKDKIFNEFFHSDIKMDDPEGLQRLGLGLCMAKAIIEKHSGTIKVEKTGPDGTTFLIELPCWQTKKRTSAEHTKPSEEIQLLVE